MTILIELLHRLIVQTPSFIHNFHCYINTRLQMFLTMPPQAPKKRNIGMGVCSERNLPDPQLFRTATLVSQVCGECCK